MSCSTSFSESFLVSFLSPVVLFVSRLCFSFSSAKAYRFEHSLVFFQEPWSPCLSKCNQKKKSLWKTAASLALKLQIPTISKYNRVVFLSFCNGKYFQGKFYTRLLVILEVKSSMDFCFSIFKPLSFQTHLLHLSHTFQ